METREVMQVKELNKRASGQAFELILSPSSPEPKFPLSPMKKRETSMDEIKRKLDAAEERRKSMEAEMLKNLAEKREHMKEVIQKAIEENCNFSKTTLEKLNHKMEVNKENLDALKAASAERFKKSDQRFEDVKNKNKKETAKEASD